MFDIPCVIFAGGKSSRMGEDKALLPFGDFKTLTQFQLHRLSKLFKTIYISCKNKDKFDFDANFIEDIKTNDTYAPTTGFLAVFEALKEERFFVISVDTPFIGEDVINAIIKKDSSQNDATIAKVASNIQPMCGIYHKRLEKDFLIMLKDNNHKLGFLLKNANSVFVDFEDEELFLNLNNKDEYKKALNIYTSKAPILRLL